MLLFGTRYTSPVKAAPPSSCTVTTYGVHKPWVAASCQRWVTVIVSLASAARTGRAATPNRRPTRAATAPNRIPHPAKWCRGVWAGLEIMLNQRQRRPKPAVTTHYRTQAGYRTDRTEGVVIEVSAPALPRLSSGLLSRGRTVRCR